MKSNIYSLVSCCLLFSPFTYTQANTASAETIQQYNGADIIGIESIVAKVSQQQNLTKEQWRIDALWGIGCRNYRFEAGIITENHTPNSSSEL